VPEIQFVAFGDGILVVSQGSSLPVLLVSPSGSVRAVRLKLLGKSVIHGFIPSATHWFVRTSPISDNIDAADTALYEFDPSDGSLIRKLVPEGAVVDEIACTDEGGSFIAFRPDDGGKFVQLVGSTGR
jgi:hypothetical protein